MHQSHFLGLREVVLRAYEGTFTHYDLGGLLGEGVHLFQADILTTGFVNDYDRFGTFRTHDWRSFTIWEGFPFLFIIFIFYVLLLIRWLILFLIELTVILSRSVIVLARCVPCVRWLPLILSERPDTIIIILNVVIVLAGRLEHNLYFPILGDGFQILIHHTPLSLHLADGLLAHLFKAVFIAGVRGGFLLVQILSKGGIGIIIVLLHDHIQQVDHAILHSLYLISSP